MKQLMFSIIILILCLGCTFAQTTTDRLGLNIIEPYQAQKYMTINEAIYKLDALVQPNVLAATADIISGATNGDFYIVSSATSFPSIGSATGNFVGKDNQLAYYLNGAWKFFIPGERWIVSNDDDDWFYIHIGSAGADHWYRYMKINPGVDIGFGQDTVWLNSSDQATAKIGSSGTNGFFILYNSGSIETNFQPTFITTLNPMFIGTSSINSNAILELVATDKVFLPPRMTTAQRSLINNVTGCLIFDTDENNWYGWAGNAWVKFATSP